MYVYFLRNKKEMHLEAQIALVIGNIFQLDSSQSNLKSLVIRVKT